MSIVDGASHGRCGCAGGNTAKYTQNGKRTLSSTALEKLLIAFSCSPSQEQYRIFLATCV